MRERPNILEQELRACLWDQYGIAAVTLEFLPLGLDTRAGVYRVVSEAGTAWLLKATSRTCYEPACRVPRYLRDQGIVSVVAPLPTKRGALWTQEETAGAGAWMLMLYPFIVGASGWNPWMTDAQWQAVGTTLRQIHQIELPSEGFASLRKETFDPGEYSRWVDGFEKCHITANNHESGSQSEQAFRLCWMAHQATIHAALTTLETLAGALQARSGPHVICHADLHPGNLIRDAADQVLVVDWDDVMLAPKERDFLFIGGAPVDAVARRALSPFFQGYGETEIDWVALTYYLWERVVQDVIECAQTVFFRDDVGDGTKAEETQLFQRIFADGIIISAARTALARLRLG
ncbi:MAG: aminoglycoside phosphotransferase family protein [Ktedonobacterales bacterium]